jgi:hypothetical protein
MKESKLPIDPGPAQPDADVLPRKFQSAFYNLFAARENEGADKEKPLLNRVDSAVGQAAYIMNHFIHRPCLRGVTPADVIEGRSHTTIEVNREYVWAEQRKTRPAAVDKELFGSNKRGHGFEGENQTGTADNFLTKGAECAVKKS